jgi:hypothetical protein
MLAIGIILFGIGLLLLSPLDDIFILLPLSFIVGMWVFPVAVFIAFSCLIIGALLIGKHLLPLIKNPFVLIMIALAVLTMIYVGWNQGWFNVL